MAQLLASYLDIIRLESRWVMALEDYDVTDPTLLSFKKVSGACLLLHFCTASVLPVWLVLPLLLYCAPTTNNF
jgi:hypothetical protein